MVSNLSLANHCRDMWLRKLIIDKHIALLLKQYIDSHNLTTSFGDLILLSSHPQGRAKRTREEGGQQRGQHRKPIRRTAAVWTKHPVYPPLIVMNLECSSQAQWDLYCTVFAVLPQYESEQWQRVFARPAEDRQRRQQYGWRQQREWKPHPENPAGAWGTTPLSSSDNCSCTSILRVGEQQVSFWWYSCWKSSVWEVIWVCDHH